MKTFFQKFANKIARRYGFHSATKIIFGRENKVLSRTDYGYRKYSTGEYVPNAYRANFGWKNTYYQSVETVVEICPPHGMLAFCAGFRVLSK